MQGLSLRAAMRSRRALQRPTRNLSAAEALPVPPGFFDNYPLFFSSSQTGATRDRLNQRYRACIEWNKTAIEGNRVLDITSHDGRWSFAAMKAGATSVVGLEARQHLVEAARANLTEYRVDQSAFQFKCGDAFELLDGIEPHSFDTVLCLGFFYHVSNHMLLLSKIARLAPKCLVIDTGVYPDPREIIKLYREDPDNDASAARIDANHYQGNIKHIVVGAPSRAALDLMLSGFGWSFVYYDWHQAAIARWNDCEDYKEGRRVTLRVNCETTIR